MCGRYEFLLSESKIAKQIKQRAERFHLHFQEGEIFPGNSILCTVTKFDKIDLKTFKWGIQTNSFQINARKESLNKIYYQKMLNNRCAIICNGFYEWDKNKIKYYIHTEDEIIYLAGIYNDNNELLIITKPASQKMLDIHERMPIIMNQKEMLEYLHKNNLEVSEHELIIELVSQV